MGPGPSLHACLYSSGPWSPIVEMLPNVNSPLPPLCSVQGLPHNLDLGQAVGGLLAVLEQKAKGKVYCLCGSLAQHFTA